MSTERATRSSAVTAEYEIICEALPLVEVASTLPDATIELELQYSHGEKPLFLVEVSETTATRIEQAFETAEIVAEYIRIGRTDETHRYKLRPARGLEAQLDPAVEDVSRLRELAVSDSIIEHIYVTPSGWVQQGQFADRATFREFWEFWQNNGEFTLRRIVDGDIEGQTSGLTGRQQEALQTAYEMGYFEIPRAVSLEEVATELGITPSSLSERLRRAETTLIEVTTGGRRRNANSGR